MQKAVIKQFRLKRDLAELALIVGGNTIRYTVNVNVEDVNLLKPKKECEFEAKGKTLVKLFVEGKEITLDKIDQPEKPRPSEVKKQNSENNIGKQNRNKNRGKESARSNTQESGESAKVPYNFVPINKFVIPADTIPEFDCYHSHRYTGYIDLEIEALTPLYIRDTYTRKEEILANQAAEACKECKDKNCDKCDYAKHRVNPDFFAPGGIPKIPGSSLRGMVRNLVEIVSYSKMEFTETEKRFYYRKVAIEGRYQRLMMKREGGRLHPAAEAGWLKEKSGKYSIYPLEKQQIYRIHAEAKTEDEANSNEPKWEVVMVNDEGKEVTQLRDGFNFYPVSFIPAKKKVKNRHEKNIKPQYTLLENKCFELGHDKAESNKRYEKGYLVLSGSMGNKKHLHAVIHCPKDEGRIEVDQDIIKSYKEDMGRKPEANLLKMLEENPDGVPCFYLKDNNGNIKSFGHTPMFRLAYDKQVKDHIPNSDRELKGIDIATAIFGNSKEFAGRVFFEDAKMVKNAGQYPALSPRVLSTPKPTTVQHYLVPKGDEIADWNDDTYIRGYKLYWHRRTSDDHREKYSWPETGEVIYDTQHTVIKALKPGAKFRGRIRFENLSNVELGALLFVLDLPSDCAHKIGMGKPLGLGSVRIKPKVVISNRNGGSSGNPGRYGKLFDNKQWYLPVEKNNIDFKTEFSRYIWAALPDEEKVVANSANDLWSIPRIKELWAMLRYDKEYMENNKWLEKTRYMEIEREGVPHEERNEFRKQPILQSPSKILNEK